MMLNFKPGIYNTSLRGPTLPMPNAGTLVPRATSTCSCESVLGTKEVNY